MDVYLAFDPVRDHARAKTVAVALEALGFVVNAEWGEGLWPSGRFKTRWDRRRKKGLVRAQLEGRGVTVVLIGRDAAANEWVEFAIRESLKRGHPLLGLYVHRLPDEQGALDTQGKNPLGRVSVSVSGAVKRASELFPTHDWGRDGGPAHAGEWLMAAAGLAGSFGPA